MKIFTTICLAICVLSKLELSFGMQNSDVRDSKAISSSAEDETVPTSAPYDIGTFANDLYRASEGMCSSGPSNKYDMVVDKFSKLAKQAASDESINDFVVIKHKGIADVPYVKGITSTLYNQKNSLLLKTDSFTPKKDSRPIHPHSKHITQELQIFQFGSAYAYGNLARYSHKEVSTCVTNAYKQISEECIHNSKIGTCLVSSLVCGLYYGISPVWNRT